MCSSNASMQCAHAKCPCNASVKCVHAMCPCDAFMTSQVAETRQLNEEEAIFMIRAVEFMQALFNQILQV